MTSRSVRAAIAAAVLAAALAASLAVTAPAHAWPLPGAVVMLGLDDSQLRYAPALHGYDPASSRVWSPSVALGARWPLGRCFEFELAGGLSEVGRRDSLTVITSGPPSFVMVRNTFAVKQVLHVFDLPIRLRLVAPRRSSWLAEVGLVPAWIASSDRVGGVVFHRSQMLEPRRALAAGPSFDQVNSTYGGMAGLHRWDLRASAGLGRRIRSGARAVDLVVRWDEGLVDLQRAGLPARRSRIIRFALGVR